MNYDPAIWQARVMSHSYLWSVFPEEKETDKYCLCAKKACFVNFCQDTWTQHKHTRSTHYKEKDEF